jgi:hypothetical protein
LTKILFCKTTKDSKAICDLLLTKEQRLTQCKLLSVSGSVFNLNSLPFNKVVEFIETYYQHQPTAFKNGDLYNEATQNQGSAKVFAFAQLKKLSAEDTFTYLQNIINLCWLIRMQ